MIDDLRQGTFLFGSSSRAMSRRSFPVRYLMVFLLVITLAIIVQGTVAAAIAVSIVDTSISQTKTRDGQTLTLNYKINCSGTTSVRAQLGCTLIGPNKEIIVDDTHEGSKYAVNLTKGVYWYKRDFFVNMPPAAKTGLYSVTWSVNWSNGAPSVKKSNILTIQPPIPVRVPILMYHKVGPIPYSENWVATDEFQAQMQALKAYGYTAVTLQDIMDCRAGIKTLPAKPVVLCFDDAYENVLTDAFPVIKSVGIGKATLFVPTGRLGGDNSWDVGDNNPVIPHMTWDEVEYLYSTRLTDMESHTVSHPSLITLSPQALNYELTQAATDIQNALGYRPKFISYPFGDTNAAVENAARTADYFAGVMAGDGVEQTCANKWELKRMGIDWYASMDYNPAKPYRFFFNQIESGVAVPNIVINSISFLNPVTGLPLAVNQIHPGSTVKIQVNATNSGPANKVVASLKLDNDSIPDNGIAFDSHASGKDITADFGSNTTGSFQWTWQVPLNTSPGRSYVSATFHDRYYVLGFACSYPLWQQAFFINP